MVKHHNQVTMLLRTAFKLVYKLIELFTYFIYLAYFNLKF